MKLFLKILAVIIGVIGITLLVLSFTKKDYAVVREITINKPKAEVFAYIKMLKNQDNFSVWALRDPAMKKEYRGIDGTVGFVSAWDSQKDDVGKGEQKIIDIKEGERIDYELHFIKPFEARDHAYMVTEKVGENATKVKWGFDGKMEWPMNIMLLMMDMDKMLGDDLQQGLNNLKVQVEK